MSLNGIDDDHIMSPAQSPINPVTNSSDSEDNNMQLDSDIDVQKDPDIDADGEDDDEDELDDTPNVAHAGAPSSAYLAKRAVSVATASVYLVIDIADQVDVQVKDEEDSVCLIAFPRLPYQVYIVQGYEDDPEPDEDEDASYADEEYGSSTKKKVVKKKKQPSKPRGRYL